MTLFSMLKRNSKLVLKGSWGRAILVTMIPVFVNLLLGVLLQVLTSVLVTGPMSRQPTAEPDQTVIVRFLWAFAQAGGQRLILLAVFTALSWLVLAPIQLGAVRWFFYLVHGKSLPLGEVFFFFERFQSFRRGVWYQANIYLRSLGWSLLFLAPPGAMLTFSLFYLQSGGDRQTIALGSMGICISLGLLLLGQVLCMIWLNRYLLAAYLLCEEDSRGVHDALRTSVRYTRGYRAHFLLFGLTFLGWLLLCMISLGIAALYTAPYMQTAWAMYGRYVIEKNRYFPSDSTKEFVVEQNQPAPADSGEAPQNA